MCKMTWLLPVLTVPESVWTGPLSPSQEGPRNSKTPEKCSAHSPLSSFVCSRYIHPRQQGLRGVSNLGTHQHQDSRGPVWNKTPCYVLSWPQNLVLAPHFLRETWGHVFQTPTQLLWTLIRDKRPKPHALFGKSLSCPHTVSGERGSFTTPRVSQGQWKPNVSTLHASLHRHIHTHTYTLCKNLLRVQVEGSFCSWSVNCRWVCRRQNLGIRVILFTVFFPPVTAEKHCHQSVFSRRTAALYAADKMLSAQVVCIFNSVNIPPIFLHLTCRTWHLPSAVGVGAGLCVSPTIRRCHWPPGRGRGLVLLF